jgi:succinoglycan biosynthesis protein ExoM
MDRAETPPPGSRPASLPHLVVTVCTYRRNEPLGRLLAALARNSTSLTGRATLAVVVVDDNPDGRAAAVVERFATDSELEVHYRTSGEGNISLARNIGLETALARADWIALTDDDCEPVDTWLTAHLDAQARWGCDVVTGPCLLAGTDDAPRWLSDQPFLEDAQFRFDDGAVLATAATNNSFLRAQLLRDNPDLRFDPALGVVGGEDMVFYRTAARHGATIRFAEAAVVRGHEPPERWTFAYQVRSKYWLGNTEFVTNRRLGEAHRGRWAARGAVAILRAVARPFQRLVRRESPQVRYAVASGARGLGMLAGAAGREVRHH